VSNRNPTLGWVYAIGGAALFGLNASSTKVLVDSGIDPIQVVILRSLANAILAGIALLLFNRQGFKMRLGELPRLLLFSLIGVAVMQWAYTNAVSLLPVGTALLFEYTAVLFVPLVGALFLRERHSKLLWAGVIGVFAGLVVISGLTRTAPSAIGVGFAMLASVTLTLYFILGNRLQRGRDSMSLLFYSMLISSGFWLAVHPSALASNLNLFDALHLGGNFGQTAVPAWALLAWVAVAGSFLPMLFSYLALRNLSSTATGVASTAETVFAFLFGWLWLAQPVSQSQWAGGALVLAGIIAAQLGKKATSQTSE